MDINDMVIMSVDDHIVEPPDLFKNHLPAHLLSKVPHVVRKDGFDYWLLDGTPLPNFALGAVVGRPREELGYEPNNYDQIRRSCFDVHARIDDMNVNGIAAGLNFGTFANFAGESFVVAGERKTNLLAVKAYNDWHIDEWCAAYPTRFFPLAITPLWDVNLMVEEIKRVIAKGCRAISFPGIPTLYGLPSLQSDDWEPLWKILDDEHVRLCIHVGAGGGSEHIARDSPIDALFTKTALCAMAVTAEYLWSDFLHRYKNIVVVLSEGGIGWIPALLERADQVLKNHGPWTGRSFGGKRPSEIFRERFITCFIEDRFGLKNRHEVGIDTITFECDFPHADITWPKTPECLMADFEAAGCTDEEIDKITHRNAARVFHFDPVEKNGGRDKINVGALRAKAAHVDTMTLIHGGRTFEKTPGKFITAEAMEKVFPKTFKDHQAERGAA